MRMFALAPSVLLARDAVVGVFDLDTATVSKHTRDFLRRAQEAGAVISAGEDLPQAFIVTSALVGESAQDCVYLSTQSSANLSKKLLTSP